jgi:hypothetical protein
VGVARSRLSRFTRVSSPSRDDSSCRKQRSEKTQKVLLDRPYPVQVFRTLPDLHWEFLRLRTGFELSNSWPNLPCDSLNLNRNILDFMSRAVFGWGEAVRFIFERETLGLRKCGFHQNSTPASAISTRYRVGLGGVAFVSPGAICALLSRTGAVCGVTCVYVRSATL